MSGAVPGAGDVLVGRYTLLRPLGRGGFGVVWEARDRLRDEPVAIKILPGLERAASLRRELSALRWLRLPGVVRLLDDGVEDGFAFLVMELIRGMPFPGCRLRSPWEQIGPVAVAIASTLARVHAVGVIHGDLKPGNVLVEDGRRPVLLDLGLATGRALRTDRLPGGFAGTPRYASPEQCRGERLDPAADLYALGVMLFEALSGAWPHAHPDLAEVIRRRAQEAAPPLRALAPTVPPAVAALVDRLLALDPSERPANAEEVALAIGSSPPPARSDGDAKGPRELRRLFSSPDLFLRRDQEAARLLWARTGGQRDRVAAELGAWRQAGLARASEDGRLVVEQEAAATLWEGAPLAFARVVEEPLRSDEAEILAWIGLLWPWATIRRLSSLSGLGEEATGAAVGRLRALGLAWSLPGGRVGASPGGRPPQWTADRMRAAHRAVGSLLHPGAPTRVRHLLAAGAREGELLDEILQSLEGRGARRAPPPGLLDLGLGLARATQRADAERYLLRRWTLEALRSEALPPLERSLFELERARIEGLEPLIALLQAARAGLHGEAGRALGILDALSLEWDEDLARWGVALRVRATARLGPEPEEALLLGLLSWARGGDPGRLAAWESWLGHLRYRQGRYEESARLHLASAEHLPLTAGQAAALQGAAAALLEAQQLQEALALAERAATVARRASHARYEALARWTSRGAAYRAGAQMRARPDLVESAAKLGPMEEGLWALTEAAFAWRGREARSAGTLARRARRALRVAGFGPGAALASALALCATAPAAPEEAVALAEEARCCTLPLIALQIYGLLARAVVAPDRTWLLAAKELVEARPDLDLNRRLEVLAPFECI